MFEFLFGGKRKLELIRELIDERMCDSGFSALQSKLKVIELSNLQLIGTPEGTIVTIVETVFKLQKRGMLLGHILTSIENHRKSLGQDINGFNEVLQLSREPIDKAVNAFPLYALYRVTVEYPGIISLEQFEKAFSHAAEVLSN